MSAEERVDSLRDSGEGVPGREGGEGKSGRLMTRRGVVSSKAPCHTSLCPGDGQATRRSPIVIHTHDSPAACGRRAGPWLSSVSELPIFFQSAYDKGRLLIHTIEENGLILLDILYLLNTQLTQRWAESCFVTALTLKTLRVSGVPVTGFSERCLGAPCLTKPKSSRWPRESFFCISGTGRKGPPQDNDGPDPPEERDSSSPPGPP